MGVTRLLTPVVPYDRAETSLSYAARLALVHTGLPTHRLLTDLGIRRADFERGEPLAVATLADATGTPVEDLQDGVVRALSRHNHFRNEDVHRHFMTPRVQFACPDCLCEDGPAEEWRHRVIWCLTAVRSCPVHGRKLVGLGCHHSVADLRDVFASPCDLERLRGRAPRVRTPAYLTWIASRLEGQADSAWLADQTLEQVIDASEMLGLVLEHGTSTRVAHLEDESRTVATELASAFIGKVPKL